MEPIYRIGDQSKTVVLALVQTCRVLSQGNVSFQLAQPVRAVFSAKASEHEWELTVSTGYGNSKRDVYLITEDELIYRYSETDYEEKT